MKLIGEEVGNKVSAHINVQTVLRLPPQEAMRLTREAEEALRAWYDMYQLVRQKIFEAQALERWEFPRADLFERTDYMAARCKDLYGIAEVCQRTKNNLPPLHETYFKIVSTTL